MSLLQQLQSLLQVEGYTHNIYTLCTGENRWTQCVFLLADSCKQQHEFVCESPVWSQARLQCEILSFLLRDNCFIWERPRAALLHYLV